MTGLAGVATPPLLLDLARQLHGPRARVEVTASRVVVYDGHHRARVATETPERAVRALEALLVLEGRS